MTTGYLDESTKLLEVLSTIIKDQADSLESLTEAMTKYQEFLEREMVRLRDGDESQEY